jgi:hypothetical protein
MQIKPGSTREKGDGNELAHSRMYSDVEGGSTEQPEPPAPPPASDARATGRAHRIMRRTISFVLVLGSLAATALSELGGLGVSHHRLVPTPSLVKGAALLRQYFNIYPRAAYTPASSQPALLFSGNSTVIQPPPNTGA